MLEFLHDFSLAQILPFLLIGFVAQIIDGALGVAFGVISQTLLVSIGVPQAEAPTSVHLVEMFTTGASGLSQMAHRNGGVTGAYLLSNIGTSVAKPFVMICLAGVGFYLLFRAVRMVIICWAILAGG